VPALSTDADRLRQRYQRVGEMENHTFGQGLPGSKPPDFNLDPDAAAARAKAAAAAQAQKMAASPTPPSAAKPVSPGVPNP
jgi:hypothetical protein